MMRKAMVLSVAAFAFPLTFSGARAATWDGSGDASWTNAANWVDGVAPVGGDPILFNNSAVSNLATYLGADFSISGLTVLNPSGAITVSSNTLTVGAGGLDLSQATQNLTLNSALVLDAAQWWTVVTNGRTLTVAGTVDNGGNLLSVTGTGAVAVSGVISGAGGLTYRGPGTMTLSGLNSAFSGPVTVNGGTLVAAQTNALGSGNIAVSAGARVQVNNAAYLPAANTVTLTSSGALWAAYANAGQDTLAAIDGAASSEGYLILGGATSSNLDFSSHAGVFLGANNNYNYGGTITPGGGAYRFGGGGVTFAGSGNTGLTLTNLTGVNDVVMNGMGLVTLGAGNTYSGRTIITNGGVVRIDGNYLGTAPGTVQADNIILDRGVLRFGSATWTNDATRGIYLGAGNAEFHPWSTANITFAGPISGPGGWRRTDSGTMTFSASNTFAGPISNTVGGTVNFNADGALGLGTGIYQAGGTMNVNAQNPAYAGAITIANSTMILNATNAIGTATSDVQGGGVLQVQNAGYLPGAGSVTVRNNAQLLANYANAGQTEVDTLNAASTGALVLGGNTSSNLNFTGKSGVFLGAGGNYTYSGTLTPAGSAYLLGGGNVSPFTSGNTGLTLTNLVGPGNDVVIGQPGTVTLGAGNTFGGRITVSNGAWLTIIADDFAPAPSTLVSNYITLDGGKLRTRGANFTINSNRGFNVTSAGTEIHVWGGYTATIAGPLSGSGSILMTDGGTLQLTADNTAFTGNYTLNAGTVYVNNDTGFGAGGSTITMNNNTGIRVANTTTLNNRTLTITGTGTITTDTGATLTVTNAIGGGGALTKAGAGTLLLGANNTYNGNTTVNGGTLRLGAAGALQSGTGKGNLSLSGGSLLDLNGFGPTVNGLTVAAGTSVTNSGAGTPTLTVGANNQTGMIGGALSGNLGLTKTGASNFTVNVSQYYTGPTTVNGGRLTLDGASLAGAVHVDAGGTLVLADAVQGLRGEYYNTGGNVDLTNYASMAAFNARLAGRTPALVANSSLAGANFDFGAAGGSFPAPYNNAEYFEARWTGRYYAPTGGVYAFKTASDDSSMLYIDGALVVSNNALQGFGAGVQNTVALTAGYHDIMVSFYEQTGGQGLSVTNVIPGGATNFLLNANLQAIADVSVGTLSGVAGGTLALGTASRLTVNQTSNAGFYGALTGAADSKLTKTGTSTLVLGYKNPGFTGAVEVVQGTLALRHTDVAGFGTITLNGGALALDTAGLNEGGVFNNPVGPGFDTGQANPGTNITYGARMADTTAGWPTNTTFIYSGNIHNGGPTNVTWTFAENFDDSVRLRIDGADILNNGTWNGPTTGNVTLTPGAHTFEARFGQGGGGAGPNSASWWTSTSMGFGYDTQGRGDTNISYYIKPTDPGDGSLFTHDFTVSNAVVLQQTTQLSAPLASGIGTLSGGLSGAGGIVKTGPGTIGLGGVNSYLGSTTVSGGTLRAVSAGAFPTTTDITVINGTTLEINGQSVEARSLALQAGARFLNNSTAGSMTLNGTGTALSLQGGVTSVTAAVRLTGASGGDVAVSGGSSAAARLVGVDVGNAARTFNVADVNAGGDDLLMTAPVTGGTGGIVKTGAGTMVLAGMGAYGGATVVNDGVLRLDAPLPVTGSALWLDAADAATVVTSGTAVTQWSDKSGNVRHMIQGTSANRPVYATSALVGGKPVVHFDGADDHLTGDFSFLAGSQYTMYAVEARQDGGNRYFLGTIGTGDNNGLHVGYRNDTAYTLAQYANDIDTPVPAYTGQLFRVWGNELDGTGHHIYLNGSNVANRVDNTTPLTVGSPTSGRVGMGFSAQYYYGDLAEILIYNTGLSAEARQQVEAYLNFKWFGTGMVLPAATAVQIGSDGMLDLNGNDQTVASLADGSGGGGILTNGAAASPLTLTVTPSGTTTFGGRIVDAGAGNAIGLVVSGSGTQVLSGDNDFHGGTVVTNAMLQLGAGGASGSIPGNVSLVGSSATLAFNRNDTYVQTGLISGDGRVVKDGSGTIVMSPDVTNTYTGGTVISNGTLQIGNGGVSGMLGGPTVNHGTLTFERSNTYVHTGTISGTGRLVQNGTGSLVLPAGTTNLMSGNTYVSNGTLQVDGVHGSGLITVCDSARLQGTGTVGSITLDFNGALAPGNSAGTLTTTGDVTMVAWSTLAIELVATNSYDVLQFTGGTLTLDSFPELSVYVSNSNAVPEGSSYVILNGFGSSSGHFGLGGSELADGAVFNATLGETTTLLQINYNSSDITLTVVPEPTAVGLFGMILVGFVLRLRRQG